MFFRAYVNPLSARKMKKIGLKIIRGQSVTQRSMESGDPRYLSGGPRTKHNGKLSV